MATEQSFAVIEALSPKRRVATTRAPASSSSSSGAQRNQAASGHREDSNSNRKKSGQSSTSKKPPSTSTITSLEDQCRRVILENLERYPPQAMGVLDTEEWEGLLTLLYNKKRPKVAAAGNSQRRLLPIVSAEYLRQVEDQNEHLSQSCVSDQLVWQPCVEHEFSNPQSRPVALEQPWPILVEQVKQLGETIRQAGEEGAADSSTLRESATSLGRLPMNVALLSATGIGKTVKRAVKLMKSNDGGLDAEERTWFVSELERTLNGWKRIASSEQTELKNQTSQPAELALLERRGGSWRQLFELLTQRQDESRHEQGRRIRQLKRNLEKNRSKIVQVRPKRAKQMASLKAAPVMKKSTSSQKVSIVQQMRQQHSATISRVATTATTTTVVSNLRKTPSSSAFGSAVAFASSTQKKKGKKRSKGVETIVLAGGKRMNVPTSSRSGAPASSSKSLKVIQRR